MAKAKTNGVSLNKQIEGAAYFSLFSLPNPAAPPEPVPLIQPIPQLAIAIKVNEGLRRFEIHGPEISPVCGLKVTKNIGDRIVAKVSMQMTPMPNNFQGEADRVPPPTILLPFLSQRFCALDGQMQFLDSEGSGFTAFGCGRTLPVSVSGQSQLRLAAVLDIAETFGKLAGLTGTGIVNGETVPPSTFDFSVLFRLVDPSGRLQSNQPIPNLPPAPDPQSDTSFMSFISEPDPLRPITAKTYGQRTIIQIYERLRIAKLDFDIDPLRTAAEKGAIAGRHQMTLIVDTSQSPSVFPAYSLDGEFSFFDKEGKTIGGFKADLLEARVFPSRTGAGGFYRLGGIAPPSEGWGQFIDPAGMVSVNGAFDIETGDVSTMYMVRLSDPLGVFQPAA